jgi:glucose-1-phosphate thymidylyltransferase
MHCFILAGGFATRLWPLTEHRAKPLLPLAGEPMLTRIVKNVPSHVPITVSTNAAFEDAFMEWKKTIKDRAVTVRIERTKSDDEKLGTLGATAQWIEAEKIEDDILLLTGDNEFGFDMSKFIAQYSGITLVAAYDIGDVSKASHFGTIVLDRNGQTVSAFEEKPKEPKSSLVSTGASILPKSVLRDLLAYAKVKPDNVGGIFEELLRLKKTVQCFTFSEPWFDIGSFEAYLEATRVLVGSNVLKASNTMLKDTECTGSIVIGDRSKVENSNLTDTVLFEDCIVEDCVLQNCIIDDGCELRGIDLSGKMLRAGTKLVVNR